MLKSVMAGAATWTWGSLRSTSATFAGTGAPPTELIKLALGGRTMMSAPMPPVWRLALVTCPIMMATIERIMTTSMATARMLMKVRTGRCRMLPKTSLFMNLVGGRGVRPVLTAGLPETESSVYQNGGSRAGSGCGPVASNGVRTHRGIDSPVEADLLYFGLTRYPDPQVCALVRRYFGERSCCGIGPKSL